MSKKDFLFNAYIYALILLVTAKYLGYVHISWTLVLSPLWLPVTFFSIGLIFFCIIYQFKRK